MPQLPTSALEARSWLETFAQSQDGLDATQTSNVYAPDASLRFGSFPAIYSARSIEDMVTDRFAKLDVIRHIIRYYDIVGSRLWAAFDVAYRVKGDPAKEDFHIPCVCVFSLVEKGSEKGKIQEVEIYMDQTVVAQRMEEVAKGQTS